MNWNLVCNKQRYPNYPGYDSSLRYKRPRCKLIRDYVWITPTNKLILFDWYRHKNTAIVNVYYRNVLGEAVEVLLNHHVRILDTSDLTDLDVNRVAQCVQIHLPEP